MRLSLVLFAIVAAAPASAAPSLHALAGSRRVLILVAPRADEPALVVQDRLLAAGGAGLAERDVTVVHVVGAHVAGLRDDAAGLRRRFGVPAAGFAVRLIGKDGHVALAGDRPVAAPRLFAAIDAMPMRRDEIARRRR